MKLKVNLTNPDLEYSWELIPKIKKLDIDDGYYNLLMEYIELKSKATGSGNLLFRANLEYVLDNYKSDRDGIIELLRKQIVKEDGIG